MSYQEKKTVTSLITGLLVMTAYLIYIHSHYRAGLAAPEDLRFLAVSMLKFIGIGIGAAVFSMIIFHILQAISIAVTEKIQDNLEISKSLESSMVEDEMDKLIELKSSRGGFILAGIGLVAGLLILALGHSPALMLNTLFLSFWAGSVLEGFLSLYWYRNGVKNG